MDCGGQLLRSEVSSQPPHVRSFPPAEPFNLGEVSRGICGGWTTKTTGPFVTRRQNSCTLRWSAHGVDTVSTRAMLALSTLYLGHSVPPEVRVYRLGSADSTGAPPAVA
jgi:hypothetical protein